jgi:Rad3-related DNA helicase
LFGLTFDAVIAGRKDQPGTLEMMRSKFGMVRAEYDAMREEETYMKYHQILIYCVKALNGRGNTLVLTPGKNHVENLLDYLKKENYNYVYDFSGKEESWLKGKGNTVTISTRMKRGVDLRDDMCRVVIWAKFPLKNSKDDYIKSLFLRFDDDNKTWKILNDMAVQDAIQGVCRGLRHEMDTCTFATPDIKVFDCINAWWEEQQEIKDRKY